ncbi:unnamed protein product [Knipowitschia caucasica]
MASGCNSPLEMAALGRPFHLGMFYDCRADNLIPGLTLWDSEKLDKDMRVKPKPSTKFTMVAGDTLSQKASSLGVDAALKASFMGGLVKVQGSADYLNDNKSSRREARVSLLYKATTEFKELTMNQLSTDNIQHRHVIDKGLATHVVSGILYGANAFFVFHQEVSEDENMQKIQGNLNVIVNKISFCIDGQGALALADSDRKTVNKFSCTFHGDFRLDTNPTTFEEALKVYGDLPKLLGPKGENAVPVMVHLLPLSSIDSKASQLVCQISLRLVFEVESILENFKELNMRCADVLKSPVGLNFPHINNRVRRFEASISEFRLGLERILSTKLPLIRGGGEDEAALANVLEKMAESPFKRQRLNQWMDAVVQEANTIKGLAHVLKNTELVSCDVFTEKVYGSEKALVFVFTSMESADPYLEELENHLKGLPYSESRAESKRWYKIKEVMDRMRHKAKAFGEFALANKELERESLRFLAVEMADENHKDATVHFYEDGFLSSESFELPSKPCAVTQTGATITSVFLKFTPASVGAENVSEYRVEVCEKGQEQWRYLQAQDGLATITGLKPNAEVSVRVRAVTEVGVGPASADVSMKTLVCFTPGDLRASCTSTNICARWTRPAEAVPELLTYVLEHAATQGCGTWSELQCTSEHGLITGLQPNTEYMLRVCCRNSKTYSESLTVRTLAVSPASRLAQGSRRTQAGPPQSCQLNVIKEETQVGSGKRSFINAMVNHVLGVRWYDWFRFTVNEGVDESRSALYEINHQSGFSFDKTLSIIDTPEFGGSIQNSDILRQLFSLFNSEDPPIREVHLCLVLQPCARLTDTQLSALELLYHRAGDLTENIHMVLTCAADDAAPVLRSLIAAGVPCPTTDEGLPVHLRYNSCALFASNSSSAHTKDEVDWDQGAASVETLLRRLETTQPKYFWGPFDYLLRFFTTEEQ